ncbi:MAG: thiamine phosphate synthase [Elusimicrobia bacterium]|nr:thiamine phosphate synthase [Elusimicrobiota bacterium]MBU2614962.1 thiamine phosphate synthase [Elusimicrobiota bacterium]
MKNNILPGGIYGITAEEYSLGRSNLEIVKAMIEGGIKVIQYREKENMTPGKKFEECLKIRDLTRKNNVLFIVNDHIDIAQLVGADGIHLGQDDISIKEARKIFKGLIGLSTHSPEQARKAVEDGADYIGVGPIYPTKTKKSVCPAVGLEYLDYVVAKLKIPFVAIGGIKEHNIKEVISHGAKTVALVTEITGSKDIPGMIKKLHDHFQD